MGGVDEDTEEGDAAVTGERGFADCPATGATVMAETLGDGELEADTVVAALGEGKLVPVGRALKAAEGVTAVDCGSGAGDASEGVVVAVALLRMRVRLRAPVDSNV